MEPPNFADCFTSGLPLYAHLPPYFQPSRSFLNSQFTDFAAASACETETTGRSATCGSTAGTLRNMPADSVSGITLRKRSNFIRFHSRVFTF